MGAESSPFIGYFALKLIQPYIIQPMSPVLKVCRTEHCSWSDFTIMDIELQCLWMIGIWVCVWFHGMQGHWTKENLRIRRARCKPGQTMVVPPWIWTWNNTALQNDRQCQSNVAVYADVQYSTGHRLLSGGSLAILWISKFGKSAGCARGLASNAKVGKLELSSKCLALESEGLLGRAL